MHVIRIKKKSQGDKAWSKMWTFEQLSEETKGPDPKNIFSEVIFKLLDIKRGQVYSVWSKVSKSCFKNYPNMEIILCVL